jgi:hypothetical protein
MSHKQNQSILRPHIRLTRESCRDTEDTLIALLPLHHLRLQLTSESLRLVEQSKKLALYNILHRARTKETRMCFFLRVIASYRF